MYTIIYLSPTGNTKHLAYELGALLGVSDNRIFAVEKLDVSKIEEDEHLILMYSIHGFNPPRTMNRFVKQLPANLFKNISILSVGCADNGMNGAVSKGIRKRLEKKGYDIVVDEVLAMPLTFVMGFPNDVKDKTIKTATSKIETISEQIKTLEKTNKKIKISSRVLTTVGKLEDPAARLFGLELHAKKSCISCGICWNNCPENNIKEGKKGKPKFGFSCMMCMRCIYECPEKAITPYVSKFLLVKGGYKLFDEEENEKVI